MCCGSLGRSEPLLPTRSGPFGRAPAQRLEGSMETSRAAVANQIYNTLIRAIEQERKNLETGELAERLEAMEGVLKGQRTG